MKKIALAVFLAISFPACALEKNRAGSEDQIEIAANKALSSGDFGQAIRVGLPKAEAGDSEFQFSVGYLMILWLDAPSPMEPPQYSLVQAISWIRKAATKNLPQAAGFLRSSYQWGRYGLPKNEILETCWRTVELAEQNAAACIEKEKLADRFLQRK